jgi:hypothetical protein
MDAVAQFGDFQEGPFDPHGNTGNVLVFKKRPEMGAHT